MATVKQPPPIYPDVRQGSISVLYKEPDTSTYKGVRAYHKLNGHKTEERVFNTGDPNYDYHYAGLWLEFVCNCDITMLSSSVDHFNMDARKVAGSSKLNHEPSEAYLLMVAKQVKKDFKINVRKA